MIPEISKELKEHAVRVLEGDILNMPLLHKQEVEKILYYCVGYLSDRLVELEGVVANNAREFELVLKKMEKKEPTPEKAGWGKKRR